MSFRHGMMTRFMSRHHRHRSKHLIRHRRPRESEAGNQKEWRHGCQVRHDLVTGASTQRSAGDMGKLVIHRDTYKLPIITSRDDTSVNLALRAFSN